MRLLALTGCRCSEVLGLHWSDVKGLRLQLRDSKAVAADTIAGRPPVKAITQAITTEA